jgi:hypothetical protein
MDDNSAELCAQQFQWALQALAQPAGVQLALFPDFACVEDELGLDFGHWWEWYRRNMPPLTPLQLHALQELDRCLDMSLLSEQQRKAVDDPTLSNQHWIAVRQLAAEALRELGWPNTAPPYDRSFYQKSE